MAQDFSQDTSVTLAHYEKFFREKGDHPFISSGYDWIHRKIEKYVPPGGSILDIGCGTGRHARLLARRGYFVCGVDISPTAIALCREKFRVLGLCGEFICTDARKLPFAIGEFDAVLLSLILHQFRDYRALLAESARVSKRWIFVFEPNKWNPTTFLRLNCINPIRFRKGMGKNERAVSPRRVSKLMACYGFTERERIFLTLEPARKYRFLRFLALRLESLLPSPIGCTKFFQVFEATSPIPPSFMGKR